MMNHSLIPLLVISLLFGVSKYDGSTKASVVLSGGIIAANKTVDTKKYKRKDCPVCKGKGWYISGDGISKVNCGYCEPDSQNYESPLPPSVLMQPSDNNCTNGICTPKQKIIRR